MTPGVTVTCGPAGGQCGPGGAAWESKSRIVRGPPGRLDTIPVLFFHVTKIPTTPSTNLANLNVTVPPSHRHRDGPSRETQPGRGPVTGTVTVDDFTLASTLSYSSVTSIEPLSPD